MFVPGNCPVLWDGDYEKEHYWVYRGSDRILCWPNAGYMNSVDGSGRMWEPEARIHVALVTRDELEQVHEQWRRKR